MVLPAVFGGGPESLFPLMTTPAKLLGPASHKQRPFAREVLSPDRSKRKSSTPAAPAVRSSFEAIPNLMYDVVRNPSNRRIEPKARIISDLEHKIRSKPGGRSQSPTRRSCSPTALIMSSFESMSPNFLPLRRPRSLPKPNVPSVPSIKRRPAVVMKGAYGRVELISDERVNEKVNLVRVRAGKSSAIVQVSEPPAPTRLSSACIFSSACTMGTLDSLPEIPRKKSASHDQPRKCVFSDEASLHLQELKCREKMLGGNTSDDDEEYENVNDAGMRRAYAMEDHSSDDIFASLSSCKRGFRGSTNNFPTLQTILNMGRQESNRHHHNVKGLRESQISVTSSTSTACPRASFTKDDDDVKVAEGRFIDGSLVEAERKECGRILRKVDTLLFTVLPEHNLDDDDDEEDFADNLYEIKSQYGSDARSIASGYDCTYYYKQSDGEEEDSPTPELWLCDLLSGCVRAKDITKLIQ